MSPEVDEQAEEARVAGLVMLCLVPAEPVEGGVVAVRVVVAILRINTANGLVIAPAVLAPQLLKHFHQQLVFHWHLQVICQSDPDLCHFCCFLSAHEP
jgi:hypothetical protein